MTMTMSIRMVRTMNTASLLKTLGVPLAALLVVNGVAAQEQNGTFPRAPTQSADRIIVKWKTAQSAETVQQKVRQLAARTGSGLSTKGKITTRMEVLQLERKLSADEIATTIAALSTDPEIEYAVPDLRRRAHALPNDTLATDQWYLLGTEVSAIRADTAWDTTTGSSGTVVAVLDTGVRYDHPDLLRANEGGKLLPGYDFISGESANSFLIANDGDGRDADASDPGDWVSDSDLSRAGFEDCETSSSSWHGTRVAGVIAASTNNSTGVAGVAWNAWILPVRVLGKCGGFDSDILAAIRWAAGLSVPGVPDNPYPAKIINLSFGGQGTCNSAYLSVVEELTSRGVLIVASAGNDGGQVSVPGNCPGVLAVTGVRHLGTKVGFSNLGRSVSLSAPGGNCVNSGPPCLFSIVTTTNLGNTTPTSSGYTDAFNFNVGTSFSAPMVAGSAALMHAVNGHLGPQEMIARLKRSATSFPSRPASSTTPQCTVPVAGGIQQLECYCTTETCGAGIVNAASAVAEAAKPVVSIELPSDISAGQDVTLDAAGSTAACNRTIASYQWSVVSASGTPPTLSATNESSATVQAPTSGEFTLRVTVTDDAGHSDSADVTVTPTSATTTASGPHGDLACPVPIPVSSVTPPVVDPPSPSPPSDSGSRGGGGGGHLGFELLVLGLLLLVCRTRSLKGRTGETQAHADLDA